MPLYEYQCKKCGHRFERIQTYLPKMRKVPWLSGRVKRLISTPALTVQDRLVFLLRHALRQRRWPPVFHARFKVAMALSSAPPAKEPPRRPRALRRRPLHQIGVKERKIICGMGNSDHRSSYTHLWP